MSTALNGFEDLSAGADPPVSAAAMAASTGFSQHHSSGRLAPSLTGRRTISTAGDLLHIDHPAGDFSRGPVEELAIITLRSPRLSLATDFGAGQATFAATSGAIFLAPPRQAPKIVTFDPHRLSCLAIAAERLADYAEDPSGPVRRDYGQLHHRSFRSPLISLMLERMWDHAGYSDDAAWIFADGALMVIAAELARMSDFAPFRRASGGMSPVQLSRAIQALSGEEVVSVVEIARSVGMSVPHFSRSFRVSMGISPHAYRTRSRMEAARALLSQSDVPIAEIAARLGYADPSYFARRFLIETGETARSFRRRSRGR